MPYSESLSCQGYALVSFSTGAGIAEEEAGICEMPGLARERCSLPHARVPEKPHNSLAIIRLILD